MKKAEVDLWDNKFFGEYFVHLLTCSPENDCVWSIRKYVFTKKLYSPDLALSDYFLFPSLKKWLGGKRYGTNDEIIAKMNFYFEDHANLIITIGHFIENNEMHHIGEKVIQETSQMFFIFNLSNFPYFKIKSLVILWKNGGWYKKLIADTVSAPKNT